MTEHLTATARRSAVRATTVGVVLTLALAGCADSEPTLLNESDFDDVIEVGLVEQRRLRVSAPRQSEGEYHPNGGRTYRGAAGRRGQVLSHQGPRVPHLQGPGGSAR